jgi:hypothetical protein
MEIKPCQVEKYRIYKVIANFSFVWIWKNISTKQLLEGVKHSKYSGQFQLCLLYELLTLSF